MNLRGPVLSRIAFFDAPMLLTSINAVGHRGDVHQVG
jgi:hypothetical protein